MLSGVNGSTGYVVFINIITKDWRTDVNPCIFRIILTVGKHFMHWTYSQIFHLKFSKTCTRYGVHDGLLPKLRSEYDKNSMYFLYSLTNLYK